MEKVEVRNNTRRALLIKVPGQALHLQPGASAEVPRAYLKTEELGTLLLSGSVRVVSSPRVANVARTREAEHVAAAEASTTVAAAEASTTVAATEASAASETTREAAHSVEDEATSTSPARAGKKPR